MRFEKIFWYLFNIFPVKKWPGLDHRGSIFERGLLTRPVSLTPSSANLFPSQAALVSEWLTALYANCLLDAAMTHFMTHVYESKLQNSAHSLQAINFSESTLRYWRGKFYSKMKEREMYLSRESVYF